MNYGRKGVKDQQKDITSKNAMVTRKFLVTFLKAFLIAIIAIAVIGGSVGVGVIKGIIDTAPDIEDVNVMPVGSSSYLYDAEGNQIQKLFAANSNRTPISIENMPEDLQHAFVAIEDERFYEHNGIDIKGIIRAAVVGVTSGFDFSEGASTITQQLIKNNVYTKWQTGEEDVEKFKRKFQEQYLAMELEKTMSKEEILENYMNTINLGQNTLGVQSASQRYFGKNAKDLTLSECAVIAAITQNPTRYNPITNPEENAERREKVLRNMCEQGYITEEEKEVALKDDVYSRIQQVNVTQSDTKVNSYFVDELINQLEEDLKEQKGYTSTQAYYAIFSGGLKIYTTMDPDIQEICDEEFTNEENYPDDAQTLLSYALTIVNEDGEQMNFSQQMMETYFKQTDSSFDLLFDSEEEGDKYVQEYVNHVLAENGGEVFAENKSYALQPQISFSVIDQNTGQVKALIGGRGEKKASLTLNRATQSTRQPGSTFKVLAAFAPALDSAGQTLATVYDDTAYNYQNGRPVSNWYTSGYKGLCTIRQGIEQSLNIVAVKTLTEITPQVGYDYLIDMGFTTLVEQDENGNTDIQQALALGGITNGVTNVELGAAYAAIANGGVYTKPIYYTKVLDGEGNIVLENKPESKTVLKETTAYLLTDAMKDVITGANGTGGSCAISGQSVAGKTGTTSNYKDVWFVGYTPYYTATIWTGYDNYVSLSTKSEKNYHKAIWQKVMTRIHEGLEYKKFEKPAGIVTAKICKKSGKLAVEGLCNKDPRGSMITTEYFAKGTVPTDYCDTHINVTICSKSKMPAGEYCPETSKKEKIYILRPSSSATKKENGKTTYGKTADSKYSITEEELKETCTYHSKSWYNENEQPNKSNSNMPDETQAPESGEDTTATEPPSEGEVVPPTTETTDNPEGESIPEDGMVENVTNEAGGY